MDPVRYLGITKNAKPLPSLRSDLTVGIKAKQKLSNGVNADRLKLSNSESEKLNLKQFLNSNDPNSKLFWVNSILSLFRISNLEISISPYVSCYSR